MLLLNRGLSRWRGWPLFVLMTGKPEPIQGGMTVQYLPLSDLQARKWAENPKDHDLGLIHQSIDEHGFNDPIGIDEKSGMIVEGHGRLACLAQKKADGQAPPKRIVENEGEWYAPVIFGVDFPSAKKAKKYALQHNRTVELGGYLDDKLLAALKEQQDDLAGIGWDEDDVNKLLGNYEASSASIDMKYEIIISCESEQEQAQKYDALMAEGYRCRLLM